MPKNEFFVSRDRFCEYAKSDSPELWKKCCLPGDHHYDVTYTIVYDKSHLITKKYDCGCVIYSNPSYYEFKYPHLIWIDFFTDTIEEGQKLIRFFVQKATKK
jgi:hypothetical protein